MVNSASQAIAEFKNKQMGSLITGGSSRVDPGPVGASLSDSARVRMNRMNPSRSSTAFLDSIRGSGSRTHSMLMQNIENKKAQQQYDAFYASQASNRANGSQSYTLPNGGSDGRGGGRGPNGLTLPAERAFADLSNAYRQRWGSGLSVTSGGRTREEQAQLYADYLAGRGNLAAPPGTSLHESGIALDLGGPIASYGTAQHIWLQQNAARFGWYWVGERYGEPWHWEYHPGGY